LTEYKIFETRVFQDDLTELPQAVGPKIQRKLLGYVYPQLRKQPHFGPNIEKLRGWTPDTWRYRIGPWRFFYEIEEGQKIILMTTLDHRKDAY
jgi:mRNA interferase RelE/StbE